MFILGFLYLSLYTYCSGKDTLISVSRLLRAHDSLSFPLVNKFCHFLSRTIFCFSFPLECQRMFHRHQPPRTVRALLFFYLSCSADHSFFSFFSSLSFTFLRSILSVSHPLLLILPCLFHSFDDILSALLVVTC